MGHADGHLGHPELPAHDLDFSAAGPRLAHVDVLIARGAADPYLGPEAVERALGALHEAGIPGRSWTYEGGHKVDPESLSALVTELSGAS